MFAAPAVEKTKNMLLEDTIEMLRKLDENELKALQSVIRVFISKDEAEDDNELVKDYYKPLTEAELIERIDRAIAQADAGLAVDSEIVEAEIMAEFGL